MPEARTASWLQAGLLAAGLLALQACGGGGSGGGSSNLAPPPAPPVAEVTITGRIFYERVPLAAQLGRGLDYAAIVAEPARGIVVEAVNTANSSVIATASTSTECASDPTCPGRYTFTVPANTSVLIRARAEMIRAAPDPLPRWRFSVRDIDTSPTPFVYDSPPLQVATSAITRDVTIPSGWSSSGLPTGIRHAAPFAILDTIYRSYQFILSVEPSADFPALTLDWSSLNLGFDTFYTSELDGSNPRIVISGEVNVDTDEYDPHVVAHEFGHYIENQFSRSDSIGGPHAISQFLDPRVAFGEGFGYAFAAMVLNDSQARDSFGNRQGNDSFFDIENNNISATRGWYSESSNWVILWDLFDPANDANDPLALGFAPIWQVLRGPQRTANALTTVFSFIGALKTQNPALANQIDTIVSGQAIASSVIDEYGSLETNDANQPHVLPIYTPIVLDGGTVTVTSINRFSTPNKLSNARFLRFNLPFDRTVKFQAVAGAGRDADLIVYRRGAVVQRGDEVGNEDFSATLSAGDYVLEVYDCSNAGCSAEPAQASPIDVTVSTN